MTDVKVVSKGRAYYENFNRIFNKDADEKEEPVSAEPQPAPRYDEVFEEEARQAVKCKHKPRFIETSLVTKPDGSIAFETMAQCEICHEQLCIPGGPVHTLIEEPDVLK